ncbi:MAG TPA: NUDIX hydrolase [Candidatus Lokiarchaeia archaeon]|nr:NUDIX hydrolase [Candidatus Lokiarchaeia archaeon]
MNSTRTAVDDIQNVVVIAVIPDVEPDGTKFLFVKEKDGALRFPGGKVKLQEPLREALQRELLEETGMNTINVKAMALIEYSVLYDTKNDEIIKSILLYFFLASSRDTFPPNEDERFTWLDEPLVASQQKRIPYDNHLIIMEMGSIKIKHRYQVPSGFLDSPKDESTIATRSFCWIDPMLQKSPCWKYLFRFLQFYR